MKKIAVIGLVAICAFSLTTTAFATEIEAPTANDGAVIETVVPTSHTIFLTLNGKGTVTVDGKTVDSQIQADRLSNPVLSFISDDGYVIESVIINGIDVTDKLVDNTYTIEGIYEDEIIEVTYVEGDSSSDSSSESSSLTDSSSSSDASSKNDSSSSKTSQADNSTKSPSTGALGGILIPSALLCGALIVAKRKNDKE